VLASVLVITGGYFLIRGSQSRSERGLAAVATEPNSQPVEQTVTASDTPGDGTGETGGGQPEDPEDSARPPERDSSGPAASSAQKQPQLTRESRSTPVSSDTVPANQHSESPRPAPPPVVGSIGALPGTSGGSANVTPAGLATDIPAAPPPPTPRPTVRRPALMAGGEVVRRVQPVFPP